ncbi:MAG TPA: hypothetical protein VHK91_11330 [Flavisolibacter sp.]|jgi:TctA family transporter|nr:hypothetical protein [Flavisolibacter sp.]
MEQSQKPNKNNSELLRYAGWGTQLFVLLALSVYAGSKADKRLHFTTPLLVWILPFIMLVLMIYKLIKDTSQRKDNEKQI